MRREALLASSLLLSGCVQPYVGPPVTRIGPTLATQDQTAAAEEQDRISRFRRLAAMQGIEPPVVEQILLPPGSVDFMTGPVPVVRVVFADRVFFDFNSAVPRQEAAGILDLIAENMKRDVPDAALTVLGHTDAIGSDEFNLDLSRRRASAVMQALAARGVNPAELSEVAIGKRQPIAPNDTVDGRARNRRVEFLVSPSLGANLAAVQQRVVPLAYLSTGVSQRRMAAIHAATVAKVYKMAPGPGPSGRSVGEDGTGLATLGGLTLSPPAAELISQRSAEQVTLAPTMAVAPVELIPPADIEQRTLLTTDNPNKY